MANQQHVNILLHGRWNAWRLKEPAVVPDLSGAHLRGLSLVEADLTGVRAQGTVFYEANLRKAKFSGAYLADAKFAEANLEEAILHNANLYAVDMANVQMKRATLTEAMLSDATFTRSNLAECDFGRASLEGSDLSSANLSHANLKGADLRDVNLTRAVLNGSNFDGARLRGTIFSDTNLRQTCGLDRCHHLGPSTIDLVTLASSGELPLSFLRGCGLPDSLIEYLPSLLNKPFQFYSCFISYSVKDTDFAQRLHADLQDAGVRCWYAPEDMKTGDKIRDRIDQSIKIYDKLLIILSRDSITSSWVEKEVETAFEEERHRRATVLFPIRLDDDVMQTNQSWAADIRRTRHIGDFTNWSSHESYKKTFNLLLRDLRGGSSKADTKTRPEAPDDDVPF